MAHLSFNGEYLVVVLHSVEGRTGSCLLGQLGQKILPYIFRYWIYHVSLTGKVRL